ncbi:MAG: RHS repeat domain-containing protein, partial [bacterium]
MGLEYDGVGFRRALEYENGGSAEYTFDPAGNLVASSVTNTDGNRHGQTLELDDSYQLIRRVFEDGTESSYKYDKNGNLLEAADGSITTRFEYDALNRLTAIVSHEGERLEYEYAPGEPSLIAQSDAETGWLPGERRDTGQTFAPQRELFATRTYAVPLGAVRFSEALGRFQLSAETGEEIVTPEIAAEAPLRKLRLWGEEHHSRHNFLAASNLLFQPAEYATVNCCPICEYQGGGEWDCDDPCGGLPPQQASVIITGSDGGPPPSNVALRAPGSTGPNEIQFEAQGTPEGGTYAWSNLDMDKVDLIVLSGTASESPNRAKVVAKAQSASQFDVQIKVRYEHPDALPIEGIKHITVQKPTSLTIVPGTSSTTAEGQCTVGGLAGCGVTRTFIYQVRDQFTNAMVVSDMPFWDSINAGSPNSCNLAGFTTTCSPSNTGPCPGKDTTDGKFLDTLDICAPACRSTTG